MIVLPEFTHRLPKFPALKAVLFYLGILVMVAPVPVGLMEMRAHGDVGLMEMPEQWKSNIKLYKYVLGAKPESVPDYYSIIGVRRGADPGEIKKAFRELSKVCHPDKTAGNPELQERFVKISEAARKLTSDRASFVKELETAELTDMVTRAVEFVMLFGLWAFMTLMSFSGSKAKQQGLSLSVFLAFFLFI